MLQTLPRTQAGAVVHAVRCVLMIGLLACGSASTKPGLSPQMGPRAAPDPDHVPSLRSRAASSAVQNFYSAHRFNIHFASITGYNDEQALGGPKGSSYDEYGPVARLYVVPGLDGITQTQFEADTGAFVGLAEIDGFSANYFSTYSDLHFQNASNPSLYCVYLRHDPTTPLSSNWKGYVNAVDAQYQCPPRSRQDQLAVDVETDNNNGDPKAFPAVMRWTEDSNGNPSIGVRCLTGWCDIGHDNTLDAPPSQGSGGREWRIKGWRDEQLLAVPGPASNGHGSLHRGPRGMVVPVHGLESVSTHDFETWQPVATIWIRGPIPTNSVYSRWGLKSDSPAQVWLRQQNGSWQAGFTKRGTQADDNTPAFIVKRKPWDETVPGVARFVWTADDDLFWIACDQGCCTVSDTPTSRLTGSASGH